MRKRLLLGLSLFGMLSLTSCTTAYFTELAPQFVKPFYGEHATSRVRSWTRDLEEIERSVDYHLFNYDWDDPYL